MNRRLITALLGIYDKNNMQSKKLRETFDRQATTYDKQQANIAPIHNAFHFLLEAVFADLPTEAHILCVGVGTGAELVHLAQKFPLWKFTAVDPSGAMLEACQAKVEKMGFIKRCHFHKGYVDSLPVNSSHDASTCFLVSQFILKKEARSAFFNSIAQRLKPGGILASSDLASDVNSKAYKGLLKDWLYLRKSGDVTPEMIEQMRITYEKHVSILSPMSVASIIESGGFETLVQFFQAGLIHAWHSNRKSIIEEPSEL